MRNRLLGRLLLGLSGLGLLLSCMYGIHYIIWELIGKGIVKGDVVYVVGGGILAYLFMGSLGILGVVGIVFIVWSIFE